MAEQVRERFPLPHADPPNYLNRRLTMDADQRILLVGLYVNAALYLVFVFIAAVWTNRPWSVGACIVCAALAYCAYGAQVYRANWRICATLVGQSVGVAICAALLLLW